MGMHQVKNLPAIIANVATEPADLCSELLISVIRFVSHSDLLCANEVQTYA